ncbi:aminoacyl-tRNA hydrolase [Aliidiomarina sp. Khilg15.8]
MTANLKLIVGLANPGPEYQATRHNAGAWLVDAVARRANVTLSTDSKFYGLTGRLSAPNSDTRLLIPTTFMNRSGQAVGAIANFYKITADEILVVHDELDLPPGVAKYKTGGGHGGHNGLKDIISALGGDNSFHRLRIGIGHPGHKDKVTGYVLGKAPQKEQQLMDDIVDEAARSIEIVLRDGYGAAKQYLHSIKAE